MTKPDLANTAPKRIYLDIGDRSTLGRIQTGDLRWDEIEGVTWSEGNETDYGIPYVRADLVPTPAASGAAPKQDGWHDPKLPPHGLLPFSFAGLSEHARGAAREYAEIYARAALASREAGKDWSDTEQSALNDWFMALPEGRRKTLLEGDRWMLAGAAFVAGRAALASPQAAPASIDVVIDWIRNNYQNHNVDSLCDGIRALDTPVQVAPPGWQPIKTAPERGIILLGLAPNEEHEDGYVSPGYWMESDDDGPDNMGHDAGFVDVHFDFFTCARSIGNPAYQHKGLQPTHWMPLPPAPGQVAPQDDARDAVDRVYEPEAKMTHYVGPYSIGNVTACGITDWLGQKPGAPTKRKVNCNGCLGMAKQFGYREPAPAAKPTEPTLPTQGDAK